MNAQEQEQAEMVDAIVATYRAADAEQRDRGRDWYPAAGRIIDGLAEWSGLERHAMAAVVAALSPRNPWTWNIADAAAVADAAVNGRPAPRVTTFNANRDRAMALATGGQDWTGTALKVRSFVRNMTGDTDAVTVDVWAVRVATAGRRDAVKSVGDYQRIADAYSAAAEIVGETPRDLQAVTWLVAQSRGTAAQTRHAATIKSGTLPVVRALLAVD